MPGTAELGSSNVGETQSLGNIIEEPNKHGSFDPNHLPDPNRSIDVSPPGRLTRKRAATLSTGRSNLSQDIGDLAINSASTTLPLPSELTRDQVCLCQPDPKIPRPRNAFILYRQHYQAQVIAQNPGLSNPEISKIIGEQWRCQTPEVKNDWKRLAEEEKQRHQRQYPKYRYQPRRAGKSPSIRQLSALNFTDDPSRCPKCGGRYISTPSTPVTPYTGGFGVEVTSRNQQSPERTPTITPHNLPLHSSSLPQTRNTRTDDPHISAFRQDSPRHAPYPHPQPLQAHKKDDDMDDIISPPADHKRRRFNSELQPKRVHPPPSPLSFSPSQSHYRSGVSISRTSYRGKQTPAQFRPGAAVSVEPQQSPTLQQPSHQYQTPLETFDDSLRLPPLQTQFQRSNQNSIQMADFRVRTHDSHAKSVEAMVMTIPYLNKIKVLAKISPPLIPSSVSSPPQQVRGAVIAVESVDKVLLSEVGGFINEHLSKDSSCAVKSWTISNPSGIPSVHEGETDRVGTDPTSNDNFRVATEGLNGNFFVEYLSIISEWHKKSPEITKYITTAASPATESDSPNSNESQSPFPPPKTIPIALLPSGFSLTTSDTHALRIAINDAYAPVDHWQWMATLWRGIIGPDITVYVKYADREELERHGGVEIRRDCAAIVVRVLNAGKLEEKTARRLGFEVMEFVRSVEAGLGPGSE